MPKLVGKRTFSLISGLLISAVVFGGWLLYDSRRTVDVSLHFEALVDGEAFVRNQFVYPNPGGKGNFRVRDFQFFVSNVRLIGEDDSYVEAESYHLARFDNDSGAFTILLPDVPAFAFQRIEFAIGVDAAANESIVFKSDLDPNGRMAWNWESGYKFVLFEGRLQVDDVQIPLVYHVGFDENYTQLSFVPEALRGGDGEDERGVGVKCQRNRNLLWPFTLTPQAPPTPHATSQCSFSFDVDLMRLFKGASTVDMASIPDVKFDRADSRMIAGNFASMISLHPQGDIAEPAMVSAFD